ncbi:restriction endonuclease subunit S [Shewanella sp.]|nr:restriction endonuclease subunit S [Shewanella sp.]
MDMFSRVQIGDLSSGRLDAEYYGLRYVDNAAKISGFGDVSTLENMRKSSVPIRRGIDMPDFVESNDAPLMVTIAAFGEPGVAFDGLKRVCKVQHQAFAGSHIKSGDLLVAMGGYAGKAAICPLDTPVANIGRHTARIVLDENKADVYYVWSFIRSKVGTLQFERYITGSVQAGINLADIRNIQISTPSASAQKYIGEKVRQAERLRAWASMVEKDINTFHVQFIPAQEKLNFDRKFRYVKSKKMTERFDAHFYPAVVEDYFEQEDMQPLLPLGKLANVFNGQTQPETTDGETCEQITVTNLSPSFVIKEPRTVVAPISKDRFTTQHDLLMCNAAHNKTYIGRDLTYCTSEQGLLPSTEVMIIRVNRELAPASYVRSYLSSKIGYVQIQSTIRGVTAHSYPVDVDTLEIPLPEMSDELKQRWYATDDLLVKAGTACSLASKLTKIAKLLVEALIEKPTLEDDFFAAQQALEAGDDSLDRALLERMTAEGIDGKGEPLFDDIDQLYDLLEQAKQALDDEDTMAEA